MKLKFKKPKSQLDEMQEQQFYKINNHLMVFTLLLLFFLSLLQLLLGGSFQHVIGEFSAIYIVSIIGIIKKMKNGIWSQYLCNGITDYLVRSFIGGIAVGLFVVLMDILHGPAISYLGDFCISFISFFLVIFIGCLILGHIRQKRIEKLENEES